MLQNRNADEIIAYIVGIVFLINLVYVLVVQIEANLQEVQTVALIIVSIVSLLATWWLSHNSPQAVAATIERKNYINHKRQEYYEKLNERIIRPMSSLYTSPTVDSCDFKSIYALYDLDTIRKNILFPQALEQLESDFSGFSKEIGKFNREVDNYNKEVDQYVSSVMDDIGGKFGAFGHMKYDGEKLDSGDICQSALVNLLFESWHRVSNSFYMSEKYDKTELNTEIAKIQPCCGVMNVDDRNMLADRCVGNGLRLETVQKIAYLLDQYRCDSKIIEKLIYFKKKRAQLLPESKDFGEKCKTISLLIDMGEYYTITDYCKDSRFL